MNTQADPEFIRDLNALVAREARNTRMEELQETDWTVERMMGEHKLTYEQSRKLLNKLAKQGHFEKVKVCKPNGGGSRIAYRPIGTKRSEP